MRKSYSPFITLQEKVVQIWGNGYKELSSLLDRFFTIEDNVIQHLNQFVPQRSFWLELYCNKPNEDDLKTYWEIVRYLVASLSESIGEREKDCNGEDTSEEPYITIRIILNKIRDIENGKAQMYGLNIVCFHHAVHLLWQYIDLSFPRQDCGSDIPQRLYLSACKRLKKGADFLFYGILRCLELASMGIYELSKCLPLPHGNIISPVLWIDEDSNAEKLYYKELVDGIKYADLAYAVPAKAIDHAAGEKADVLLMPLLVPLIRESGKDVYGAFHYPCNLNGYVAYSDVAEGRIYVGFSGTENARNWRTNITQFLFGPDAVYLLASELLNKVATVRNAKYVDWPIHVYGHSLGGGLMQYAICNCHSGNIRGFGYNSAGLSVTTYNQCTNINYENIIHLYQPNDVVFLLPFTYQAGYAVKMPQTFHGIKNTHGLDVIRNNAGTVGMEVAEII